MVGVCWLSDSSEDPAPMAHYNEMPDRRQFTYLVSLWGLKWVRREGGLRAMPHEGPMRDDPVVVADQLEGIRAEP